MPVAEQSTSPGMVSGRVRQYVWVACENDVCANFGAQRQLWLQRVAYGFVQIPNVVCEVCGMVPQMCIWEGDSGMPKIHVGRAPTYAADIPVGGKATAAADLRPWEPLAYPVEVTEHITEPADQPEGDGEASTSEPAAETVGEEGPELVDLPDGTVVTAAETEAAAEAPPAAKKTTPRKSARAKAGGDS